MLSSDPMGAIQSGMSFKSKAQQMIKKRGEKPQVVNKLQSGKREQIRQDHKWKVKEFNYYTLTV